MTIYKLGPVCPQCEKGHLVTEVRGYDNLAVTAKTWLVCDTCDYQSGPFDV